MSEQPPGEARGIDGLVQVLGDRLELQESLAQRVEQQIISLIEGQLADMATWVGRKEQEIRHELHAEVLQRAHGLTGCCTSTKTGRLNGVPIVNRRQRAAILADVCRATPRSGDELERYALTALRGAVNARIAQYYQESRPGEEPQW